MTDKRLKGPINWFGGKGRMVPKILALLPSHQTYVEPYGGGASVLFGKTPSLVEVYNDLDSGLVNLFRVLRDKDKFAEFHRLVLSTPYSREEYDCCLKTWASVEDEVERAYRWFVVARQSFGGRFGASWGPAVTASNRGMAMTCSRWLTALDKLPEIQQRLMQVQIEHKDGIDCIKQYDRKRTIFYVDPPYLLETRRSGGYVCEMSAEEHEDLLNCLLDVEGMVLLSSYPNSLYDDMLTRAGWEKTRFETACHVAGRTRQSGLQGKGACLAKQPRVEIIWRNPAAVKACNKPAGELCLV